MKLPDYLKEQLLAEARFSASRSSGPGGQNVNKVNTRIELRFSVQESAVLNESQKQLVLSKLKNRINSQQELIVTSGEKRTQWQNRENVVKIFFGLLEKALTKPPKRKRTQPTNASRLKRLESKKIHGEKKLYRKPPEV